ncbi:unnamed protein product [Dicrocoelium dendriticum]|nr:unnamed protein product [Dicrocoelium dendriticum]
MLPTLNLDGLRQCGLIDATIERVLDVSTRDQKYFNQSGDRQLSVSRQASRIPPYVQLKSANCFVLHAVTSAFSKLQIRKAVLVSPYMDCQGAYNTCVRQKNGQKTLTPTTTHYPEGSVTTIPEHTNSWAPKLTCNMLAAVLVHSAYYALWIVTP